MIKKKKKYLLKNTIFFLTICFKSKNIHESTHLIHVNQSTLSNKLMIKILTIFTQNSIHGKSDLDQITKI